MGKIEGNLIKVVGLEKDVVDNSKRTKKKAKLFYEQNFKNGFSEKGIISLIEIFLKQEPRLRENEVNTSKLRDELIGEMKKYVDNEIKKNLIDTKKKIIESKVFKKYMWLDLKKYDFNSFVENIEIYLSKEVKESDWVRVFPNLKILFDEYFNQEIRISVEERLPNSPQKNISTFGGRYGKFEHKMIYYNIGLEDRAKIFKWLNEMKEESL